MSNITTIYDQILVKLDEIYPSPALRIPDAYDLPSNPEQFLRNGYGLKVGDGTPEESEFKSKTEARTFIIVLSREILKIETDVSPVDVAVKAMLEDINTGQKIFFNVNQIDINASIENIALGRCSEVVYFKSGDSNFISMEYDIIISIQETL